MNDKILTIIVTFNGMKWIDKCIQSVLSSTVHSDIFVIDNASTDKTSDYIAKTFTSVKLIRNKKNLGFGAANNIGLQYAIDNNYDYIYLLNQDAWVKEDTFEKMISTHQKHPEYGILSPLQFQANENHLDFNFGATLSKWDANTKVCEDLLMRQKKEVVPFPRIMAAHWLICRSCLINVGGFSPAFFHYGEDNNYADRAWHKGYKVGVVMNAIGIHDREIRVDSDEKKCLLEFCSKISDICGFKMSTKEILWNYTYEIVLCLLFSRKLLLRRFNYYIKFLLSIRKYQKAKQNSIKQGAFLKID
ncbi:MAG: glycosyltransferase family 2 protein [Fibrobacter sp.]|nr:glycosyltransferase family 2 protein [Fibrobacter sp.]